MVQFLFSGLETAVNQYLKRDPDTLARMEKLQDKLIKIEIIDWNYACFLQVTSNGLKLSNSAAETPDAIVRGKCFDLLRELKPNKQAQVVQDAIKVDGDIHLVQEFEKILKKVDVDWEEQLAHYVGDSIAHQSFVQLKKTGDFFSRSIQVLKDNFQEFIHEELSIAPSSFEVEDFYQKIAALQNDVDRIEARIARLNTDHQF
jgi:ubiquinone biosynthesis protein UbiJ